MLPKTFTWTRILRSSFILGITLFLTVTWGTNAASLAALEVSRDLSNGIEGFSPQTGPSQNEEAPEIVVKKGPPNLASEVHQLVMAQEQGGEAEAADFIDEHNIETLDSSVVLLVQSAPGHAQQVHDKVRGMAGAVLRSRDNLSKVALPIPAIKALSAQQDVVFVGRPHQGYPHVVSQGVEVIGADPWQSTGFQGQGIKVAIIDRGFQGYRALLGTELPDSVTTRSFRPDDDIEADIDHGTRVAEIVHDVAPEASLYLVNFGDSLDLSAAVDWLIEEGVVVINHSISWINVGPGDGTGPINSIVDRARDNGILWVNSAGNYANRHWEGTYTDPNNVGCHDYNASGTSDFGNSFNGRAGEPVAILLSWDDWFQSDQDYDLYLVRSSDGALVAFSENFQTGTQPPVEEIFAILPTTDVYFIAICRFSATRVVNFKHFTPLNGGLQYRVPSGSIGNPSDSPSALAVGATNWSDDSLEPYSSLGPTTDGRTKPDISAPDCTSTSGGEFCGTSGAAPHAAGAAALVKQANPGFTPNQVKSYLEAKSLDLGAAGKDNLFGSGRLRMGANPVACGSRLKVDTTLDSDLNCPPGHGLIIGADGITLDLNGHTITGDSSPCNECPFEVGVLVDGHTGVTIKNGTVSGFVFGLILQNNSDGNVIEDIVARDHQLNGISLFNGSDNNHLVRCTGSSNGGFGIILTDSHSNLIENCTFNNNPSHGMVVVLGSSGNTFTGNTTSGNGKRGMVLNENADNNLIQFNTVGGNNNGGIRIQRGSDNNHVHDNSVTRNLGNDGIRIDRDSMGNEVHDNFVDGNRRGIGASRNSDSNLIHHNTITGSVVHGIRIDRGSDNNQVSNNSVQNSGRNGLFVQSPDPTDPEPEPQYNTDPQNNSITENALLNNGSGDPAFNDITDQTTDSGTLGTQNFYQDNECDTSSPAGLCTVPPLEAEPSFDLFQDLIDGATGLKADITQITDPLTGSVSSAEVGTFQARLTYPEASGNPTFAEGTRCVNILDIREMDIPITAQNIGNDGGTASFNGLSEEGAPAPVDLGHSLTRLTGSAVQPCSVTTQLVDPTDSDGNPIDVVPPSLTHTLLLGDARADGVVSIADALFIAQYLVGLRDACTDTVDTSCLHSVNAASVRHDGAFDRKTIADALFIAQHLVGLRDEFYNVAP